MANILLIGEPMGLFSATETGSIADNDYFRKSIAGAELNVGIGLARLNHQVNYITRLGEDQIGKWIAKSIQANKMNTQYITFSNSHTTGLMMKSKVEDGDPDTAYFRKGSAFTTLSINDVKQVDFSKIDVVHVTGIPPAVSETVREAVFYLMKEAKESGTFVTFDPNLRPSLWDSPQLMVDVLNDLASYADVVLPGVAEGKALTGSEDIEEIATFYLNKGAQVVITKSGSDGAFITEKGQETINVKGFKVEKVIDTVGAGDGFAVGILHGYLKGLSWKEAAVYANAIGSLQVQHEGDNEGLPTEEALDDYTKKNK